MTQRYIAKKRITANVQSRRDGKTFGESSVVDYGIYDTQNESFLDGYSFKTIGEAERAIDEERLNG